MAAPRHPGSLTVLRPLLACAILALVLAPAAQAQNEPQRIFYDQGDLALMLESNRTAFEEVPEVTYDYYVLRDPMGEGGTNRVLARHQMWTDLGNGDPAAGRRYLDVLEFLNRRNIQRLSVGDTLVVPSHFGVDFRAYAPFPLTYPGGANLDKLFIIDKGVQAWAAYENGQLQRWGVVSTGAPGSETPNGRFNFNWKEEDRVSTLSPPGETWRMRWVFNFHDRRGIHVHQYRMPTSGPASHGCVRLITADAQWIYTWADGWRTTNGGPDRGLASRGRVLEQGTMVLVTGTEPTGAPQLFTWGPEAPSRVTVTLPADPWAVPPGTEQQRVFDARRARASASS